MVGPSPTMSVVSQEKSIDIPPYLEQEANINNVSIIFCNVVDSFLFL